MKNKKTPQRHRHNWKYDGKVVMNSIYVTTLKCSCGAKKTIDQVNGRV